MLSVVKQLFLRQADDTWQFTVVSQFHIVYYLAKRYYFIVMNLCVYMILPL